MQGLLTRVMDTQWSASSQERVYHPDLSCIKLSLHSCIMYSSRPPDVHLSETTDIVHHSLHDDRVPTANLCDCNNRQDTLLEIQWGCGFRQPLLHIVGNLAHLSITFFSSSPVGTRMYFGSKTVTMAAHTSLVTTQTVDLETPNK